MHLRLVKDYPVLNQIPFVLVYTQNIEALVKVPGHSAFVYPGGVQIRKATELVAVYEVKVAVIVVVNQ